MVRRGFTLVEIIIAIVIMGILAGGGYISVRKLYERAAVSRAISDLSFDSMRISTQIAALLQNRIPASVIGYDPAANRFESIYDMDHEYHVLEWIGTDWEAFKAGAYSGLVDMERSDRDTRTLYSPDTDIGEIDLGTAALVFAGSFDEGGVLYGGDFNDSFGWHGNTHNAVFTISAASHDTNITLDSVPQMIYEKYYLAKSAYAIARTPDIDTSAQCIQDLNLSIGENTLFLFYNYRPWQGETFCADTNGANHEGNVTILSGESGGFEVEFVNGHLIFDLTLSRKIRGTNRVVSISKQKGLY